MKDCLTTDRLLRNSDRCWLNGRFDRPNGCLRHLDILFDGTRTGSDRTNHDALAPNRKSAPKYDDLTFVAAVDAFPIAKLLRLFINR
jgi:hypothetical protein